MYLVDSSEHTLHCSNAINANKAIVGQFQLHFTTALNLVSNWPMYHLPIREGKVFIE